MSNHDSRYEYNKYNGLICAYYQDKFNIRINGCMKLNN